MKKLSLLAVALLCAVSVGAQQKKVGETIEYNGKTYYVGPNIISNPTFDNGFTGWYDGTSTAVPGTEITSANWVVNADGGVDGNWLQGTANKGKNDAGSLGTAWEIENKIYYFSLYVSRRKTGTDGTAYQKVSATNEVGTETLLLYGTGSTSDTPLNGDLAIGEDTTWTLNECIYDNTSSDRNYQFMQCFFRWQGSGVFGFDKFYLGELYDADEITPSALVFLQLQEKITALDDFINSDEMLERSGLTLKLQELLNDADSYNEDSNVDDMNEMMEKIDAGIAEATKGLEYANELVELLMEAQTLLNETSYPGVDELQEAITAAQEVEENYDFSTADDYKNAVDALEEAINTYRMSQDASKDNPADYTFLIENPNFTSAKTDAEESSDNRLQTPWVKGSTYTGGDQRLNYIAGHTCWNAWWNVTTANANGQNLDIHQDLSGLPSGYYGISCLAITQTGCLSNQHAYATSVAGTTESPIMTTEGWDAEEWETLTTGMVLVNDGNLTIGFTSDKTNAVDGASNIDNREGWWCVTHFTLQYYGPVSDEEIKAAYEEQIANANAMVDTMHFAADKAAYKKAIEEYSGKTSIDDINEALANLQKATAEAQASEAKYTEIWSNGKIMRIITDSIANAGSEAYGLSRDIVDHAYDLTLNYMNSDEATYTAMSAKLDRVWRYASNYSQAYNAAGEAAESFTSKTARDLLVKIMGNQKIELTTSTDTLLSTTEVDALIEQLKAAQNTCEAQEAYEKNPDATDYTTWIINPDAAAENGWTLAKGTGNTNRNKSQYYTGDDTHYYFDSWNGTAGKLNFYGYQQVTGIPNGKYTITACTRTSGEGAYIFGSNDGTAKSDTIWSEIAGVYHVEKGMAADGGDSIITQGDLYGTIWEEAFAAYVSGDYTTEQEAIANAHNGMGFGWGITTVADVEVNNHTITIGMCTDSLRTGKPFTGTWFSTVDWTLTLTEKGNNDKWTGPASDLITGISTLSTTTTGEGIWNLQGVKLNSTSNLPRGIYIIRDGNKTKKIYVK